MKSVTIDLDKSAVLEKVSRMFTQTPESVLLEILQNARRAGAKNAEVWILEDRVMISNDGRPLSKDDWKSMFSLGSSSWEGETKSEDPAGCGFFISSLYDKVVIASRPGDGTVQVLRADRSMLTKLGEKIPIETKSNDGMKWSTSITLIGNGPTITSSLVEKVAKRLDMRIYLKVVDAPMKPVALGGEHKPGKPLETKLTNFEEAIEKQSRDDDDYRLKFLCREGNVKWYWKSWGKYHDGQVIINYHGHIIHVDRREVMIYRGDCEGHDSTGHLYAKIDGPVDLKLVLPGRNSVIDDESLQEFLLLARRINGDRIAELPDGHKLSYRNYLYVKETNPDLPEAVRPTWANEMYEDEKKILATGSGALLSKFLQHHSDSNIKHRHHVTDYDGYAWYEQLRDRVYVGDRDLRYRIDDGPLFPELDDEEREDDALLAPHEGGGGEFVEVKKIEIVGHNGVVLLSPPAMIFQHELADDMAYGSWFESSDCSVYWCPDQLPEEEDRKKAAIELENVVMSFWESSDDTESDNYDTQQTHFTEAFRPWLYGGLCPEEAHRASLEAWVTKMPSCAYVTVDVNDDYYGVSKGGSYYHPDRNTVHKKVGRVCRKDPMDMTRSELFMELSALNRLTLVNLVQATTK